MLGNGHILDTVLSFAPLQVAPGVYVGLGYRTRATEVNEPLYFLMVHDRIESLL